MSAVTRGHSELDGARRHFRYRRRRVASSELLQPIALEYNSAEGPGFANLADVAPSGAQLELSPEAELLQGNQLLDATIRFGHEVIWSGSAEVVWSLKGRAGIRFTSGLLDLSRLVSEEPSVTEAATKDVAGLKEYGRLPTEWRSQVSQLRQTFLAAKSTMDRLESDDLTAAKTRDLVASYYEGWSTHYLELMVQLFENSLELDPTLRDLAISYATQEILPFWQASPMLRRVYEKPLGYAGDYKVMQMYIARELFGDSLFGKFQTHVARNHSLGKAVSTRVKFLKDVFDELAETVNPLKIVSLACGPAVEAVEFIRDVPIGKEVHFVFVDQDLQALEAANTGVEEAAIRYGKANVTSSYYHYSIKQILRPRSRDERSQSDAIFSGAALIYTSGLFDYLSRPIAKRLTERLFRYTAPGGRILFGNLRVAPDVTWHLDFVLDWPLLYRTEHSMLDLARDINSSRIRIRSDETSYCLFLEALNVD